MTKKASEKDFTLNKTLEYLALAPLILISLVTIGYSLGHLKWSKRPLSNWFRPFIPEETLSEDEELSLEKQKPTVLWSISLAILGVIPVIFNVLKLIEGRYPQLEAILSLVSWSQAILLAALSRSRYCPVWLLISYLSFFAVELATFNSWVRLQHIQVISHYTTTLICLLSIIVVLLMPFRPISPTSGPISVVGTEPSSTERSPEDSLRLWQFLTSSWVWPLLALGKRRQLEKEDVWQRGYGFQTGRVIAAFRDVKGATLFRRLIKANGVDCSILVLAGLASLVCST
jgi:hypothetical protein